MLRPSVFTGPVFAKELRVAAHRRRTFWLRFAYVALLGALIVMVWANAVHDTPDSPAARIYSMAEGGQMIVGTIAVSQFLLVQLLAIVLMSTSISDEIHHRTLAAVMTTPINSFQIVFGKLWAKLWQLAILMGVSVPLLAMVRVFGGVPWDYIMQAVCLTVCTSVLVGAVSMYFSIFTRRAYAVMLKTIILLAVVFILLPIAAIFIVDYWDTSSGNQAMLSAATILCNTSPYMGFYYCTGVMAQPGAAVGGPFFSLPLVCGVTLGASALLLTVCVMAVRKAALRQATGEVGLFKPRRKRSKNAPAPRVARDGAIRTVRGSPIVWRELRQRVLKGGRLSRIVVPILIGVFLAGLFAHLDAEGYLKDENAQITFIVIIVLFGLLSTCIFSATGITTEKESRSWPVLLTTTLNDWQILLGKAAGIWRRCVPIWCVLFACLFLFTLFMPCLHAFVWVHMGLLVLCVMIFFTGMGLYFGVRLRRTTPAVLVNLAVAIAAWCLLPFFLVVAAGEGPRGNGLVPIADVALRANPVMQAVTVTEGAVFEVRYRRANHYYRWESVWSALNTDTVGATHIMLANLAGYSALGGVFFWRARRRLRRNID